VYDARDVHLTEDDDLHLEQRQQDDVVGLVECLGFQGAHGARIRVARLTARPVSVGPARITMEI
jgi:hypothetical protein